jgi:arylsulfatase A-like enzyme|tara:strand:- start:4722 stop:5849 length:1128 start_codon:yes stop_codon:yes gene_type:complete
MTPSSDYNVILINLDGLRNDKVELCPSLRLLKERSYYFPKMFTVAPYTFAALPAVFSGMYASKNGANAYYNMFNFRKDKIETLAEIMQKSGFYTSCDIIDDSVVPNQGFDEYNIYDENTVDFQQRHMEFIQRLSKKDKFFLFLHNTETHKKFVRDIIDKKKSSKNFSYDKKTKNSVYESFLQDTDEYISLIINTIKDCNIKEKTVLIIFSDHGTSLGEKDGEEFYGTFVYDYTINVFCIMHVPGMDSDVIDKQCRTIDLLPTIAELISAKFNNEKEKIQGESLFPLIRNKNMEEREVFVETGGLYGPWPSPKKHNVFCIRKNKKKLIYNQTPKTWEFYDLESDPKELNNIYAKESELIKFYKERLFHYLKENLIQ